MKRERRIVAGTEVRVEGTPENPVISGYAAVFNQPAQIPDFFGKGFREVIRPGAFTRAIAEKQDARAFFNHDSSELPLGRVKSGTLRLSEDERGLKYEIDVPNTSSGRDLAESIRRGDVDSSSFGFKAKVQTWSKDGDVTVRELKDVDLMDVSPVNYPAYSETSVSVRSLFPDGAPEQMQEELTGEEERKKSDAAFRERMTLRLNVAEKF